MRQVVAAVAEHPTSRNWQDIVPDGDQPLSVEAGLFVYEEQSSPFRVEQVTQYGFVNTTVPLSERAPECVTPHPERVFGSDRSIAEIHYQPGTWGGWTQRCGDYLVGFGYTQVPGQNGPFAWLLIHAYHMEAEESPVPGLATTLVLVSIAVVGLAALLARGVSTTVVRPITRAGEMANAVADGDLSVRIPVTGHDDVAVMSRAVNIMADRLTGQIAELERANETQRRFVSDVAHELRTPTSALLASAEALLDPASREEAAVLVASQLERLASLTEDLLEISRMDAGRAELVTSQIDLADLAAEVIADSGAAVDYYGPAELLTSTDPARLRVVLRNLVANALQHGAPPATIAVTPESDEVLIDVHDGGPGVPEELRATAFDRFVRGDQARHGSSAGLGLAIAAENARLLGGSLTLEADGATFRLRLPSVKTGGAVHE
ncbi:MAG: HAMP domain-containing sensor histidine kinase [Propionicimonas sp.]|uniref:HAMP domain-containing sensor histidine kinase n=1 Tax=Propionicimonas sp. TaxID=1955623 RepID=UPI002B1F1425|nr:HAMP domain-containing sensor histidine kinase [Propionicimonas sp.]MEA4943171.1 HAMP domain-containing sensor histidine kinase [Propionicimonas sp.]